MIRLFLALLLVSHSALAYVPTIESLFRNGSNADITSNGVSLTLVVKKIQPGQTTGSGNQEPSLLKEQRAEDFYKMFFTKDNNDALKVAQTRYENNSFSEASLLDKIYFPNFTPFTLKGTEESERGMFMSLLQSLLYNNGAFLVNYLKTLSVPVRLNNDLINRDKVEALANYKHYLVMINKDRNAKKTEANPLRPEDSAARERVEQVMNGSMYVDTHQVKLSRENGEMAWLVSAGPFEAVVSYKEREVQRIRLKSQMGEFEVLCKDYGLANGTHHLPRYLLIKDYRGETYQVELTNLRHYSEREDDLVQRLKKWDGILQGKESLDPRPAFLL